MAKGPASPVRSTTTRFTNLGSRFTSCGNASASDGFPGHAGRRQDLPGDGMTGRRLPLAGVGDESPDQILIGGPRLDLLRETRRYSASSARRRATSRIETSSLT